MKKSLILAAIFIITIITFFNIIPDGKVYAAETSTQSQLLQLKESQAKTLKEYQTKYGSDTYGLTAYILHAVQIYSIPFCFLGIVISIIYKVVIGVRNLENAEKGLGMIVAIVTLTIICQVLPLVFAVVVKLGKE